MDETWNKYIYEIKLIKYQTVVLKALHSITVSIHRKETSSDEILIELFWNYDKNVHHHMSHQLNKEYWFNLILNYWLKTKWKNSITITDKWATTWQFSFTWEVNVEKAK